jgi:hypothetical protein
MDSQAAGTVAPLIEGTAPDGARFVFSILPAEHQCCVTRNGDRIFLAPADQPGIDAAVELLMRACDTPTVPSSADLTPQDDPTIPCRAASAPLRRHA